MLRALQSCLVEASDSETLIVHVDDELPVLAFGAPVPAPAEHTDYQYDKNAPIQRKTHHNIRMPVSFSRDYGGVDLSDAPVQGEVQLRSGRRSRPTHKPE